MVLQKWNGIKLSPLANMGPLFELKIKLPFVTHMAMYLIKDKKNGGNITEMLKMTTAY